MTRTETLPCANCETPVAPGDLVCPGCGAQFAEEKTVSPETLLDTVCIADYHDELQAGLAQGILAEAGIDSFLADPPQASLTWAWRGRQATIRVREDRAESALALLADWQGQPAADEAGPAESASAAGLLPATVKGYSGTVMKFVLLLGLGYIVFSMWRVMLVIYIFIIAAALSKRWF